MRAARQCGDIVKRALRRLISVRIYTATQLRVLYAREVTSCGKKYTCSLVRHVSCIRWLVGVRQTESVGELNILSIDGKFDAPFAAQHD